MWFFGRWNYRRLLFSHIFLVFEFYVTFLIIKPLSGSRWLCEDKLCHTNRMLCIFSCENNWHYREGIWLRYICIFTDFFLFEIYIEKSIYLKWQFGEFVTNWIHPCKQHPDKYPEKVFRFCVTIKNSRLNCRLIGTYSHRVVDWGKFQMRCRLLLSCQ